MGATMGKTGGTLLDSLPTQGTLHVVMLGLDSAGKTTALYRLKFDQYLNTVPTIGFNCEKVQGTVGRAKGVHFLVWDVGGQEKLRPLWRSYTRCTDGILFVVDSVDVERMEEAKMELMRTAKCPDNHGVPVLILANKQDLPGARDPKELEKLLGLHELSPLYPSLNLTSMSSSSSAGCGSGSNTAGRSITPTSQYNKTFGSSQQILHYSTSSTSNISTTLSSSVTSTNSGCSTSKQSVQNMSTNISATSVSGNSNIIQNQQQQHHHHHHHHHHRHHHMHLSHQNSTSQMSLASIATAGSSTTTSSSSSTTTTATSTSPSLSSATSTPIATSTNLVTSRLNHSPSSQQNDQYHSQKSQQSITSSPPSATQFKGWYIQPACAITGEGLQEGLEALYDMIIKKRKMNKANKKRR